MNSTNATLIKPFSEVVDPELSYFGGKATNIFKLFQRNILIPKSYVIPTQAHNKYLSDGFIPELLVKNILKIKKQLGGKIIIRSSATCEDGDILSMAGVFRSEYITEDNQVEQSIYRIYEQSQSKEVEEYLDIHSKNKLDVKMALLVQELIEPSVSGVIYTGVNTDQIFVQYITGLGADLVDGKVVGSALLINSNRIIVESQGFDLNPFPQKLIPKLVHAVQNVQRVFPNNNQDIEFACTKDKVYILQARTLTTDLHHISLKQNPQESLEETKTQILQWIQKEKQEMGTKTAVFSDSNYSELLPKPAPMDIGIYQYISGGSHGRFGATQIGRKEMGYKVGKQAIGIIHYLGGKTYFSLARNAAIYNIGFPDTTKEYFKTLVNEYLDKVTIDTTKAAYPQMGLYLQDPTIDDLKERFGEKANKYFKTYKKFVQKMNALAKSFLLEFQDKEIKEINEYIANQSQVDIRFLSTSELVASIHEILEHIRTKTYVDFVKAARLGFYYSQRIRDLFSDEIYSVLNQGLDGSEITDSNILIAKAQSEEESINVAKRCIGHFSTGEMLEIRHKVLRDCPEKIKTYVQGIRSSNYVQEFTKQKQKRVEAENNILKMCSEQDKTEIELIIKSSQKYMALRETVKYLFTKEYACIRDRLIELCKRLNVDSKDIFYLFPEEIKEFARHQEQFMHLIQARKQSFINAEQFDLPSVIRESDVKDLSLKSNNAMEFSELSGTFLADGETFEGIVVNADEYMDLKDALEKMGEYKKQQKKIVLVAKQMNLSHDPLIIHANGLIIENAGIVAHGAQRARELGKGALAGIQSRVLHTGLQIKFDMKNKLVRKI